MSASAEDGHKQNTEAIKLTDQFQSLMKDGSLDGWYTTVRPIGDKGAHNEKNLFTAKDDLIHVYAGAKPDSRQTIAVITTEQEFSEYVFEIDYRWLGPRFAPRQKHDRDAGVLFHIDKDAPRKVWPISIECQIGESKLNGPYISGDLWVLGASNRLITPQKNNKFASVTEGGVLTKMGEKSYSRNPVAVAKAKPGINVWNTIRVIVKADEYAIFQVNGETVNEVYQMQRKVGDEWKPLTKGQISLQAEWAEMHYRNPRIRKIHDSDPKPQLKEAKQE